MTLEEQLAAKDEEIRKLTDARDRSLEYADTQFNRAEGLQKKLTRAIKVLKPFAYRVPVSTLKQPDGVTVATTGMDVKHFRDARNFVEKQS